MATDRPLFIPVILGTVRQGRMSLHAARLMTAQLTRRAGIETELIDIAAPSPAHDDAGEAVKDPSFAAAMERADALVIVSPEYNHGYSGLLKHVLDSCLKEYVHKAAGVVGVSASPFGGVRGIQDLAARAARAGARDDLLGRQLRQRADGLRRPGQLLDPAFLPRIDKFLNELVWMARTLRHGREHVQLGKE